MISPNPQWQRFNKGQVSFVVVARVVVRVVGRVVVVARVVVRVVVMVVVGFLVLVVVVVVDNLVEVCRVVVVCRVVDVNDGGGDVIVRGPGVVVVDIVAVVDGARVVGSEHVQRRQLSKSS